MPSISTTTMASENNKMSSSSPSTTSVSLKRKRPPNIEIPNVLQEIQKETLKFKDLTPQNDVVSFTGIGFAVSSIKGKKKFMEDTHKIVSCLQANSNKSFFGVYDGHGGKMAAEFVAEKLHTNIFEMMKNRTGDDEKEEAIKAGFLKTDQEFLNQGLVSGTCCVTALIEGQEVVVSNVGDCRAVLCRGGVAEALTTDHKAEREDERKRIENQGGYVEFHRGAWRVHGILSVSRSIGDAHLKNWVPAEPETKILRITSDMEFLVLASDGLWEQVTNQEAVDTVKQILVGKTLGPSGGASKDNDENYYGCVSVNVSPLSKLRRVSLVRQPKETSQSPRYRKTIDSWKGSGDDFARENVMVNVLENIGTSPLSKLQRVSLIKQSKETSPSPRYRKTVDSWKDSHDFACENVTPLAKPSRTSLVKRINVKTEPSSQENIGNQEAVDTMKLLLDGKTYGPSGDLSKNNDENHYGCVNTSPSSKLRRVSLVNHSIETSQSPRCMKTIDSWKDSEDDFACENAPPAKARRISLVKRINVQTEPSNQENIGYKKTTASLGLKAACKELANLALSRGCLDDITVMIIDLNHFRCNNS